MDWHHHLSYDCQLIYQKSSQMFCAHTTLTYTHIQVPTSNSILNFMTQPTPTGKLIKAIEKKKVHCIINIKSLYLYFTPNI